MRKTLKQYKIILPYFTIPFHKETIKSLRTFLKTVIRDFFGLQFLVKWGFKKIPIIHVDHPLDKKVPFRTDKIDIYLDFVNFWIRPLSLLIHKLGVKKAMPVCAEYLDLIAKTYKSAADIYRFRMTTTNRPPYKGDHGFCRLHLFDPHYMCVPSLHISIVVLAWNYYSNKFTEIGFSEEDCKAYTEEIYQGALDIAETVLYVKQHSVNCIPAALYMMTYILPNTFTIEKATQFIDNLFINATDISAEDKASIHSHIQMNFERFILEGCNEDDWTIPVKRWLLNYPLQVEE